MKIRMVQREGRDGFELMPFVISTHESVRNEAWIAIKAAQENGKLAAIQCRKVGPWVQFTAETEDAEPKATIANIVEVLAAAEINHRIIPAIPVVDRFTEEEGRLWLEKTIDRGFATYYRTIEIGASLNNEKGVKFRLNNYSLKSGETQKESQDFDSKNDLVQAVYGENQEGATKFAAWLYHMVGQTIKEANKRLAVHDQLRRNLALAEKIRQSR